jgi:hypothetical protein
VIRTHDAENLGTAADRSSSMGTVVTTQTVPPASQTPQTSRRKVLELSWVIGVVLFVIIRFVIAYGTLARYGRMTVIIFGVLDIATAVPYALGTARVVTGLVDHRVAYASRWAMIACASFVAPYVWLAWAGREDFPLVAYVVIGVLALLLGLNAVVGIIRNVRSEQRSGPALDEA